MSHVHRCGLPARRVAAGMCVRVLVLLMLSCQGVLGTAAADYSAVRVQVEQAYAQQAEEMAQTLAALQSVTSDTAAAIKGVESACGS